MIISEIVGDTAEVISLIPPNSSPHTYDPKPSDVAVAQSADIFFIVSKEFDGWTADFSGENVVEIFPLVPDEDRLTLPTHSDWFAGHDAIPEGAGETDWHFWTDPMVVKEILPGLVEILSENDPSGAEIFRNNAEDFSSRLDVLNDTVNRQLEPWSGEKVLLFHPSFGYFLKRYNLELAGIIEPWPGQEPSPRYIIDLVNIIEENRIKAVFIEPQLPETAGRTISDETRVPLLTIDPVGGVPGRDTYESLILYNSQVFVSAFGG